MILFHKDHLGSTRVVTDEYGNKKGSQSEYTPFGLERNTNGQSESSYKYTDQEQDAESGLYNYDARMYDPGLRVFTSADPMISDLYNPQLLNRYAYVLNNPFKYTDPTGNSVFNSVARVGQWGLKALGRISRDQAKRNMRKNGEDILGSKKALKTFGKNKGKKDKPTSQPGIARVEKHGEGQVHVHTADRKTVNSTPAKPNSSKTSRTKGKKAGHGFIGGLLYGLFEFFDPAGAVGGTSPETGLLPDDPEDWPEPFNSEQVVIDDTEQTDDDVKPSDDQENQEE